MTSIAGGGLIKIRKLHLALGVLENQTTMVDMRLVLRRRVAHGMIMIAIVYFHFFALTVRNDRNNVINVNILSGQARVPQILPWRANGLQSLGPTLIKHT